MKTFAVKFVVAGSNQFVEDFEMWSENQSRVIEKILILKTI